MPMLRIVPAATPHRVSFSPAGLDDWRASRIDMIRGAWTRGVSLLFRRLHGAARRYHRHPCRGFGRELDNHVANGRSIEGRQTVTARSEHAMKKAGSRRIRRMVGDHAPFRLTPRRGGGGGGGEDFAEARSRRVTGRREGRARAFLRFGGQGDIRGIACEAFAKHAA